MLLGEAAGRPRLAAQPARMSYCVDSHAGHDLRCLHFRLYFGHMAT